MIKDKLSNALSNQVNAEYYSAYLYLAMSACMDRAGFHGAANWLFVQAQEEMAHGTHMYQYILERGAMPSFKNVEAPEVTVGSLKEVFEKVCAHEQHVTELINGIATIAMSENDHAGYNFISWFVNEQVEEESTADKILTKIKHIGNNPDMLLNLDSELAARVFVNPFPATAA